MQKFPASVLSPAEVRDLLAGVRCNGVARRNRLLIRTLYGTALRCSEALDLRVGDLSPALGQLLVRNGKGGKSRIIGVPAALLLDLQRFSRGKARDDLIFTTATGRGVSTAYVRRMVAGAGQVVLKRRTHPHQLRHSSAFHLVNSGVDLRVVQRQLGHANLSTTDTYVNHLGNPAVVKAIQGVDWAV